MFESPFPSHVAFVMLQHLPGSVRAELHADEMAVLSSRASEKRRAEFVLGRQAAREALKQLGVSNPPPVLKGTSREPLWPEGVVGSISHCNDWAAAVVANDDQVRAIGIDLQRIERRRLDISNVICHASELDWVSEGDRWEKLTMIFSAKESIYKAFSSLTKQSLGWKDVRTEWVPDKEAFKVELLKDLTGEYSAGFGFEVGLKRREGFVFSGVLLPG